MDIPHVRGPCTFGLLLQGDFGRRSKLLVADVPTGFEIPEEPASEVLPSPDVEHDQGPIIAVAATDAPPLPGIPTRVQPATCVGTARAVTI